MSAKFSPFVYKEGTVSWEQQAGDFYLVTGVTPAGGRFRRETVIWRVADSINLWRGSVWLVRHNKRYLIRRVRN